MLGTSMLQGQTPLGEAIQNGSSVPGTFTDNSSGAINYEAQGDTYRGLFGDWFNKGNIEKEDFARNEQAKDNDLIRQMRLLGLEQEFNANEAKKAYERSREARQTQYQDMVQSLKAAGLNPILAYSNNAMASAPSASSSGGYSSSGYRSRGSSGSEGSALSFVLGLAKMVAGAITENPAAVVSGFTDVTRGSSGSVTRTRTYDFKK